MKSTQRRVRPAHIVIILAAVVVLACLGYVWQRTDPAEGAARNYLKALASGDADLACTLVTEPFAGELATRHEAGDCPAGVEGLLAGLSDEQRHDLGEARLTPTDEPGWLEVGPNPLGITVLRVDRIGEKWLVSGDR